jgi:hypothetical protein
MPLQRAEKTNASRSGIARMPVIEDENVRKALAF